MAVIARLLHWVLWRLGFYRCGLCGIDRNPDVSECPCLKEPKPAELEGLPGGVSELRDLLRAAHRQYLREFGPEGYGREDFLDFVRGKAFPVGGNRA